VQNVETPWGEVRVKVGKLGKQIVGVSLEFEDLKKIAKKEKLPLKDIYRETIRKFYESIPKQDHSNLFPAREDTSTREDRQKEQFEQDPSICGKGQEKLTLLKKGDKIPSEDLVVQRDIQS